MKVSAMVSRKAWETYLKSICEKHAKWWKRFAPIDVSRQETARPDLSELMAEAFKESSEPREPDEHKGEEEPPRPKRESVEKLNVVDGLRKHATEHVLLVGRPGSGKTTSLVRLLLEEAEAARDDTTKPIPVLLELKHYQDSLMGLLRCSLGEHGLDLSEDDLSGLLDEGRLLLLFDGLNELPSEDARRAISTFRNLHRKTSMAFTTRELGGAFDLGMERTLEMLPLTKPQVKQFLEAYLPGRSEAFVRHLRDRVRELARTPLFLSMLCALFKVKKNIPQNLGLVFREFTSLYEKAEKRDSRVKRVSKSLWRPALQQLAFGMIKGDSPIELQVVVPENRAEQILRPVISKRGLAGKITAEELLNDLINHHIIQRASWDTIEFPHQLIQEYYTAEHLLTLLPHLDDKTLKREYLNYLKWTEPLALMLELVDEKLQALRVVRASLDVDLILGARMAGGVKSKLQSESIDIIANLHLPDLLRIHLLGATCSPAAFSPLRQAVEGNAVSRIRRMPGFSRNDAGEETQQMSTQVPEDDDDDFDIRYAEVEALENIGTDLSIPLLIERVGDRESSMRWRSGIALSAIGTDVAVAQLIRVLNGSDTNAQQGAAVALGRIGTDITVEPLVAALDLTNDQSVRLAIVRALGRIGSDTAISKLASALIRGISGVDYSAWQASVDAAISIGSQSVVLALKDLLEYDDYVVQVIAVRLLGIAPMPEVKNLLLEAMKNGGAIVAREASRVLARTWDDNVLMDLSALEADSDPFRRDLAMQAQGMVFQTPSLENSVDALRCGSITQQAKAARRIAMDERGWTAELELIEALRNGKSRVGFYVARALGRVGSTRAVPCLIEAMKNCGQLVANQAAVALGRIGGPEAYEGLLDSMMSAPHGVRRYASVGLMIAGPAMLPALRKSLLAGIKHRSFHIWAIQRIQSGCRYYDHDIHLRAQGPRTTILHLSDLHFSDEKTAELWFSQLESDLTNELKCKSLDITVISGDVGTYSTKEEYDEAKEFLRKLMARFNVAPDNVIIVPGNHDVNYGISEEAYAAGTGPTGRPEPKLYRRRFCRFSRFYRAITGRTYSTIPKRQATMHHIPELGVVFLGLNSAWRIDKYNEERSDLCDEALGRAMSEMAEKRDEYEDCLKIAVWHHPATIPADGCIKRSGFLELLAQAGFRLALHGHIHDAQEQLWSYDSKRGGRRIDILAAGTFGAKTKDLPPAVPWQYSLITIDKGKVEVQARRRTRKNGAWKPDARWLQGAGENPLPYYEFGL